MISVVIIEDHVLLANAFELILHTNPEFSFRGSAATICDGLELVYRVRPDVLLLDVDLPDGDGIEAIPGIKESCPDTQIIVLTRMTDENTLGRAINHGVSGFLSKTSPLNELLVTISQVASGEIVMPAGLLVNLLKRNPSQKPSINEQEGAIWEDLTPRESEILTLLALGESGDSIAGELNIAPLTVRTHIRNIMSKLGVHSRLEAVSFGLRYGLIEHPALVS